MSKAYPLFFVKTCRADLPYCQNALSLYAGMITFLTTILFVILTNLTAVTNVTHTENISAVCDIFLTAFSEDNCSAPDSGTEVDEAVPALLNDSDNGRYNLNNNRRRYSRTNTSKQFRESISDTGKNFSASSDAKFIANPSSPHICGNGGKAFIKLGKLII